MQLYHAILGWYKVINKLYATSVINILLFSCRSRFSGLMEKLLVVAGNNYVCLIWLKLHYSFGLTESVTRNQPYFYRVYFSLVCSTLAETNSEALIIFDPLIRHLEKCSKEKLCLLDSPVGKWRNAPRNISRPLPCLFRALFPSYSEKDILSSQTC